MNNVNIIGKLTKKPVLRNANGQESINTVLSVFNKELNDYDYIMCEEKGADAEEFERRLDKGSTVSINGSIRSFKFSKEDGTQVYVTAVRLKEFNVLGSGNYVH